MRQTLYFRHFKPPKPSKPKVFPYHERLMGIGWASMACGCGDIARKSEGFGFILRSFVILNHRPPHQASHHATPDPSGGNAAVVRDKKVMRLSVLPDIRRTTFSIPYLCHTYLNKRECCQTYSNLDCHKSDGFLALTDNRKRSFTKQRRHRLIGNRRLSLTRSEWV